MQNIKKNKILETQNRNKDNHFKKKMFNSRLMIPVMNKITKKRLIKLSKKDKKVRTRI